MPFVIAQPCIDVMDGECVDVCPVDCIHTGPGERQYFIDPDGCIDCNACALYCPVTAIFSTFDLPVEWKGFERTNAAFFGK
jgi:ferredoxin